MVPVVWVNPSAPFSLLMDFPHQRNFLFYFLTQETPPTGTTMRPEYEAEGDVDSKQQPSFSVLEAPRDGNILDMLRWNRT